jgi:hypothetical protein
MKDCTIHFIVLINEAANITLPGISEQMFYIVVRVDTRPHMWSEVEKFPTSKILSRLVGKIMDGAIIDYLT